MHLPALGHRRPFPVADRSRDGEPYRHMHPRLAAIDLLQVKIADKQAGLDPYDHSIFILIARQHETVWANRALELVGTVLPTSTDTPEGGRRFRAILEADVRVELNLDNARRPPLMDDEPLASRTVDTPDDAILQVVHPQRFQVLEGGRDDDEDEEPVPLMEAALLRARHAAALRVDCGCGTPAKVECGCSDVDRMASALNNGSQVH